MCLAYQGYVPGIISATLELPIMIWLILTYWQQSQCTISEFAIYFVFAFMVMMLNLRIMHELMPHIQARMTTYTKTSSL
nr:hypothetical protein [Lacticaseibacillus chiayiensis]